MGQPRPLCCKTIYSFDNAHHKLVKSETSTDIDNNFHRKSFCLTFNQLNEKKNATECNTKLLVEIYHLNVLLNHLIVNCFHIKLNVGFLMNRFTRNLVFVFPKSNQVLIIGNVIEHHMKYVNFLLNEKKIKFDVVII